MLSCNFSSLGLSNWFIRKLEQLLCCTISDYQMIYYCLLVIFNCLYIDPWRNFENLYYKPILGQLKIGNWIYCIRMCLKIASIKTKKKFGCTHLLYNSIIYEKYHSDAFQTHYFPKIIKEKYILKAKNMSFDKISQLS